MGLYGTSCIGKTLLCKGMCYELDGEFDGKVCHLQLGNQSERFLLNEALTTLTNTNMPEIVQEIGEEEVLVLFTCNGIFNKLDFTPFNS